MCVGVCVNMCVYLFFLVVVSDVRPITVPVRTHARTRILSLAKRQNGQLSDSSVPGWMFFFLFDEIKFFFEKKEV